VTKILVELGYVPTSVAEKKVIVSVKPF